MSNFVCSEAKKTPASATHLPRCDMCPARNRGVCQALDDRALAEFRKISRRRFVREGDIVFHEGDESNYFYTIVFGSVMLFNSLSDGRQHIVELLHQPCFIGPALNKSRPFSAKAVSDVELCYYPVTQFEDFAKRHVELGRKVLEMTIKELDLCRDRTLLLARKNSLERVASFLLMVVKGAADMGCGRSESNAASIRLPFTRAEMADYLGLTLETVSRQLGFLKRHRIIELRSWRDLYVPDVCRLAEVANIEAAFEWLENGALIDCSPLKIIPFSRTG